MDENKYSGGSSWKVFIIIAKEKQFDLYIGYPVFISSELFEILDASKSKDTWMNSKEPGVLNAYEYDPKKRPHT